MDALFLCAHVVAFSMLIGCFTAQNLILQWLSAGDLASSLVVRHPMGPMAPIP
jgi:hypothetical protein